MRTVQRIYAVHLHMFWPITRCQSRKKVDRKRQSIVKHRVRRCKMKRRQMRDTKSNTAHWPSNCAFLALRRTHQSMKDCLTIRWENKRRLSIKKKLQFREENYSPNNSVVFHLNGKKESSLSCLRVAHKNLCFQCQRRPRCFHSSFNVVSYFFLMKEKQGGTL